MGTAFFHMSPDLPFSSKLQMLRPLPEDPAQPNWAESDKGRRTAVISASPTGGLKKIMRTKKHLDFQVPAEHNLL